MQAPGGPEEDPTGGFKFGGWVAPVADVDLVFGEEIGKLFGEPFDLLLGRRTYDIPAREAKARRLDWVELWNVTSIQTPGSATSGPRW